MSIRSRITVSFCKPKINYIDLISTRRNIIDEIVQRINNLTWSFSAPQQVPDLPSGRDPLENCQVLCLYASILWNA